MGKIPMRSHPTTVATLLIALAGAIPLSTAEEGTVPARADQSADSDSGKDIPPPVVVLMSHELEGILGREVQSATGENMGRIVDVVVDRAGQVRAAVIDFGGFLGVGSRRIAIDWDALSFPAPDDKSGRVTLEFTRDQVKAAPEYRAGRAVIVLGAQGKLEPFAIQ
jgi:sporulation protein YlmC with PRC-barrel domain